MPAHHMSVGKDTERRRCGPSVCGCSAAECGHTDHLLIPGGVFQSHGQVFHRSDYYCGSELGMREGVFTQLAGPAQIRWGHHSFYAACSTLF